MHLSVVQWLVIFATIALEIAVLIAMIRRNSRKMFPFFFAFVVFSLLGLLVQTILLPYLSSAAYFYEYWSTIALGTLLSFAVMYEVFINILKPYSALLDFGKLLFKWAFVFLALASVLTAFATTGTETDKICSMIRLMDRSCGLMQCGLLLLLIVFESRLGLSWRSPAIVIMVGFGASAAISLTVSYLTERIPGWNPYLDLANTLSCVVIYGSWFACFALPQPARRTVQDSPTRLILQRWNEALMTTPLVRKPPQPAFPVDSFLPGVEQTVERVMARKMMH